MHLFLRAVDIKFFSGSNLENPRARIRAELTRKVSPEIRNFSTSHGLVFQGARPRIIRITRSCRTESRIGCIGILANPTCWRLTIGSVAMISDEQGRADGDSGRAGRTYIGKSATKSESHPVFAAGGHTRIPSDFPRFTR